MSNRVDPDQTSPWSGSYLRFINTWLTGWKSLFVIFWSKVKKETEHRNDPENVDSYVPWHGKQPKSGVTKYIPLVFNGV